jgi:hypothetical protein
MWRCSAFERALRQRGTLVNSGLSSPEFSSAYAYASSVGTMRAAMQPSIDCAREDKRKQGFQFEEAVGGNNTGTMVNLMFSGT